MTDRFTLEDYFDDGTAIIDTSKSDRVERIVITLPVYIWALEPLVNLMNELDRAAVKTE